MESTQTPWMWVGVAVCAVLVLGAAIWYVWGRKTPSTSPRRTTNPSSTTTGTPPPPNEVLPTKAAQYVSLKRVSDSSDTDPSLNANRTLNIGTIAVFGVVNGSIVPLIPVRVTSTPRHMDAQSWDAGNVTDGNPNTSYHSDMTAATPDNANPWITLDFGAVQSIYRVLITPRPGYDVRMVGTQLQLGSAGSTPEVVYARNVTTAAPFYDFVIEGTGDVASGAFRR